MPVVGLRIALVENGKAIPHHAQENELTRYISDVVFFAAAFLKHRIPRVTDLAAVLL